MSKQNKKGPASPKTEPPKKEIKQGKDNKESVPLQDGQRKLLVAIKAKWNDKKTRPKNHIAANVARDCAPLFDNVRGIDGTLARYIDEHWKLIPNESDAQEVGKEIGKYIVRQGILKADDLLHASSYDILVENIIVENKMRCSNKPYINYLNGAIDLATGKAVTGDERKALGLTYVLPYPIMKGSDPVKFLKFIQEVVPNPDQVEFLLDIIATCLLSKEQVPSVEYILFLVGGGSNGKSVLMSLLEYVFGSDNVSHIMLDKTPEEYFNTAMEGKLLNIATESGKFIDPAREKSLASREPVVGRDPYGKARTIHKLPVQILSMNEKPIMLEHTHGIARKRVIIDFPKKFTSKEIKPEDESPLLGKKNPRLREELKEESPQILNMLIERAKKILKHGDIIVPLSILESMETSERTQNPVSEFLTLAGFKPATRYVENAIMYIGSGPLQKAFNKFCEGRAAKKIGTALLKTKCNSAGYKTKDMLKEGGWRLYVQPLEDSDRDASVKSEGLLIQAELNPQDITDKRQLWLGL